MLPLTQENKQKTNWDCSNKYALVFLGIILIIRVVLTVFIFRDGFVALTADDYGRIISAANWSKKPFGLWSGPWLPFHMYFFGLLLKLCWNLFWMPRVVVIIFGLTSIIATFFIGKTLFKNNIVALIGTALLSLSPGHIWLSSTPLTELISNTFILIAIWQLLVWLNNKRRKNLIITSLFLAIANGFRFESWVYAAIMSLIVAGVLIHDFVKKETPLKASLISFFIICLPWIYPIAWLIGNYIATNDFFYSLKSIQDYKLEHYGGAKDYGAYFELFFEADPFLLISFPILVVMSFLHRKKYPLLGHYLLMSVVPLIIYIAVHNGQVEPFGNYVRYFLPFSFLFYPLLGKFLISLSSLRIRNFAIGLVIVILIFLAIVPIQIKSIFAYTNYSTANAIDVGKELAKLVDETGGNALTENRDWGYLSVQIGANDDGYIYFDRPFIWVEKNADSLLISNPEQFKSCVLEKEINVIAFKDPDLIEILENDEAWIKAGVIHHYTLFRRTSIPIETNTPPGNCPLMTGFN